MTGIFYVATAVTRRWNGYRNKSQHRKLTLEKKILPALLPGLEPAGTFDHESDALTSELSPLPVNSTILQDCITSEGRMTGLELEWVKRRTMAKAED